MFFELWSVLGRFSAKVGPGTVTNGSGLTNGAQIDEKQLGRPILGRSTTLRGPPRGLRGPTGGTRDLTQTKAQNLET